ncbi:MAG: choice-of-anchor B family protein [Bacteroidota bacterium]
MKFSLLLVISFITLLQSQTGYNVALYGQMNKSWTNPAASNYSEVWGWTDSVKHREYAFIGGPLGTIIVDITTQPVKIVDTLIGPTSNNSYKYHEFRTYKNYLFIGSEGTDINLNAGIQIVDLSTLPDSVSLKKVFVWTDTTNFVTNATRKYYRAHTLSIENNFLYVNGGDFGGTRIMDISDPLNPKQAGSYGKGSTPYVHDAVIRNDTLYAAAINEGRMDIVDLREKRHLTQSDAASIVSKTATIPEGRTHQVWLSDNGKYAFVCTEAPGTTPYAYSLHVYDISNRTNPIQIAKWISDPGKSIHNAFVQGDLLFIAYYTDGLRILDISDPSVPIEVGFYKTYNGSASVLFAGAWGVYPYFPSGNVVVSDMNTGLYALTVNRKKGGRISGRVRDAVTQQLLSGVDVTVQEMGRKYTSDVNGAFIYGSAEGKHTITFSKAGYISKTETLYTKPGVLDSVNISLSSSASSVIGQVNSYPAAFALAQNFPNPFNPATTISFSITERNFTTLSVSNALGQSVTTLLRQHLEAGEYRTTFNAATLPSGMYYYTLTSGNNSITKRMVLIK